METEARRRRWLWNGGLPLLLLLVALIPRVVAFGPMSNPDEIRWLERSVAFYDALARGDWATTLGAFHPGVVPAWGFGASLSIRYGLARLRTWQAAGTLPMADLARTALAFPVLLSVLTVLAVYGLVRRLAGREAGFYAAWLLALEPFYLAFAHTIHLDLTQASLMLIAALLWLNYLRPPRRWPFLVGSGLVGGLALLTRTAALYLIPFSLLAAGVHFLTGECFGRGWKPRLLHTALAWLAWLGLLALAVVVLWPAMWVKPAAAVARLIGGVWRSVENPHPLPTFFLGRVIQADPGMLYYPLILLFRLRPLTLALVVFTPIVLGIAWCRLSVQQRTAWLLGLAYPAFYFIQMSLASHKLDRYLVPVISAFSVLAGVSLAVIARWLSGLLARRGGRPVPETLRLAVVAGAVLLPALSWLRLAPDFGTYFNPLLGGGSRAAQLFTVGSGGAPDKVADYLNAKPGAEDLWVLSFYPTVFQAYFKGHTQAPGWGSFGGVPVEADYVVVTLGQVQRDLYPLVLDFFLPRRPEYTAHLNDLDYAWVYRVPRQELDAAPPIQQPLELNFEHRVHLIGYDLEPAGDRLHLTLYWSLIVSIHQQMEVTIRLVDGAGHIAAEWNEPPWSGDVAVLAWPGGHAVRDEHTLPLPAGLPPGDYTLLVSLSEWTDEGQERWLKLEGSGGTEAVLGAVTGR